MKKQFRKIDIVNATADRLEKEGFEISQYRLLKICSALLQEIVAQLEDGRQIELRGFGKFRTIQRPTVKRYNPRTREPVTIPSKRVIRFVPFVEFPDEEPESIDS